MAWIYEQATGKLTHNGLFVSFGYSGLEDGKNNPDMQTHIGLGPIPRGKYTIALIVDGEGNAVDYEHKKAPVMRLVPDAANDMFGRDGFLIHGDSISAPGTASHGCIIESHADRELIAYSPDKELSVI